MTTMKPNILLIMTDQMIPMLTGAYGHPVVRTPNLDRLAKEGVRFDSAYTPCPICAPARASLMTGQYISRICCYDNAAPLGSDVPTVCHYLTNAGYETVASGKLHYVGPDQLHGFRRRLTPDIYPAGFDWATSRTYADRLAVQRAPHARSYATPNVGVRRWSRGLRYDERTHFCALEYLRDRSDGEKETDPFFLCVSYHHPHEPFHVTQDLWDQYEGAQIDLPSFPENLDATYSAMDRWLNDFHGVDQVDLREPSSLYTLRRSYYGLVSYVDAKVGELLAALEKSGLDENTVVLFTGDHGDMLCEKGMVQKRSFYEWSARIPLIVRFPDGQQAGSRVNEPVSLLDLAPTIADLAGVEARLGNHGFHGNQGLHDGCSLLPLLEGREASERVVLSEMHCEGVHGPCFMVRKDNWKYIYVHGADEQLFNLDEDPGEWYDLSGDSAYCPVVDELKAHVLSQFDPEEIGRDVRESLARRKLIRQSMKMNGTNWDYLVVEE